MLSLSEVSIRSHCINSSQPINLSLFFPLFSSVFLIYLIFVYSVYFHRDVFLMQWLISIQCRTKFCTRSLGTILFLLPPCFVRYGIEHQHWTASSPGWLLLCRSKLNGRIYFAGRFFRVFDRGQNNCSFDSAVKNTNMRKIIFCSTV